MSALLSVREVSYSYPGHDVLRSITFDAEAGEFLVLLGINGAGKSTLLNIIAGLTPPAAGQVFLRDRPLTSYSAKERPHWISHLPQGARHELPFTVEQVVLMGRYPFSDTWFESAGDRTAAEDAMARMNCLPFRGRLFSTLSGGERQRVLLAASLAQCPRMMLLDEPSTYLDIHQQLECFATLRQIAHEGALCIAVTHDLNLAFAHCTRILLINDTGLAADLPMNRAAADPEWVRLLSPRLHMSQTPDGKPWIQY